MGKRLFFFLTSINGVHAICCLSVLFCSHPRFFQQWIMWWFKQDMKWLFYCPFKWALLHYMVYVWASGIYQCVFGSIQLSLKRFGVCLCPWINVLMCPFACMHISVCALHSVCCFFFPLHVLKAILRVTFQKPWRAALLSVCARLCDSVWVEKAQGHISGPLPITELHSLQMILWWGKSGGTVVERKWPSERKQSAKQTHEHPCAQYT